MVKHKDTATYDLFGSSRTGLINDPSLIWPAASRFPLNLHNRSVKDVIFADLEGSKEALIITGYASLVQIIEFSDSVTDDKKIRILFGNEPYESNKNVYRVREQEMSEEAEAYWLRRGISLYLSGQIVHAIELIKQGVIEARYLRGGRVLHAKIYVGDTAATLGSSNFSKSGLSLQLEANARFSYSETGRRFEELQMIAENYWQEGTDYSEALIDLLSRLLKIVTWEEALAKACAELLEGEWAQKYLDQSYLSDVKLWPSQKQGIAQALYVLSNQGSVLIADATGSGKTKLGVHLIGAIQDQILRSNRLRRGKPVLVCPPLVEESWNKEAAIANVALNTISQGKLSTASGAHNQTIEDNLRRAQILCVDEGHNFLNTRSNRTKQLLRNLADHVVVFTATPINKGVKDLLKIADLLGADNLQESTVKSFKQMLGFKRIDHGLTLGEEDLLRGEIQRFTVRRTKSELNRLIAKEPELYKTRDGRTCRFPEHKARYYPLKETQGDLEIAVRIAELSEQLHAVSYFQKTFQFSKRLGRLGFTHESYLKARLESARKLAKYEIQSSLRSSRIALAEHIEGTRKACKRFALPKSNKTISEGVLHRIREIQDRLPTNKLEVALPTWLTDAREHLEICRRDYVIYGQILKLLASLTDSREDAKSNHLIKLVRRNSLVIAFDSKPLTLDYLKHTITQKSSDTEVLVASGSSSQGKRQIIEAFQLGAQSTNIIALCSDALAEGVNLQAASTMVHLDMPTVIRIAEQRAGRVDRIDSRHEVVDTWWPDDAAEFTLTSDDKFIERYETVETFLGSNMPLPSREVSNREVVSAWQEQEEQWDGIDDAFAPVKSLIEGSIKGSGALVKKSLYTHYLSVKERVFSRVSLVQATTPWAFFCLSAGVFGAPRWVLFEQHESNAQLELGEICQRLRQLLVEGVENKELDKKASGYIEHFSERLNQTERTFLPKKKQRALEQLEDFVDELFESGTATSQESISHLMAIRRLLNEFELDNQPDWDEVAARWLDIIRPIWFEKLQAPRSRPLLLKDIRKDLSANRSELLGKILQQFQDFPVIQRPEERIRSCIIGVD